MDAVEAIGARIRAAASLPELFATAYDAFEVIRLIARATEDREPELLAAFMSAADAAVDGKDAVTLAPSLPAGHSPAPTGSAHDSGTPADHVADALDRLADLLGGRLTIAATNAAITGDQAACRDAADAAQRICQLLGRGHDDGHVR